MANRDRIEKVDRFTASPVGDRMEHLKRLFPEALSENKLDFDKLREVLGTLWTDSLNVIILLGQENAMQ